MFRIIKKYLIEGIAWGCFVVVANLIRASLTSSELLPDIFQNFISYALIQIIVVMGFVSTLIIFEITRLHIGLKLLIHLTLALGTLLIVGFSFGIYSTGNLSGIPVDILSNSLILLFVWVVYFFEEKQNIKKINQRLLEKSLEQQSSDVE